MIGRIMLATKTHSKRNPACGTKSTNRASPTRRDGVTDNKIFMLSTRDALNEKQITEKHFYLICCDVWNRFVMETKTLLYTLHETVSSRKDAFCVPCVNASECLPWTVNHANTVAHTFRKRIQSHNTPPSETPITIWINHLCFFNTCLLLYVDALQ